MDSGSSEEGNAYNVLTGPDFKVQSRGYWLDATDEGVRITDPATNGKMTIPRDQITAVIAGLNA